MTSPAGWYEDPEAHTGRRYWDGSAWTDWVADDAGEVATRPAGTGPVAFRRGWPLRVVGWFVLALVGASVVAGFAYGLVTALTGNESDLALTFIGFLASFASAYGLAVVTTRRFGTGSIRRDVGVAFSGREALAGLGTAVMAVVAAALAGSLVATAFGADLDQGVDQFGSVDDELAGAVLIAMAATFAAPFFEEVLYRGLLLPALRSRVGAAGAIVLSAAIFSIVHLDPRNDGPTNAVVVASTLTYGIVFGWQAVRAGGIGRTIVAHALVNAYVSAFVISGAT